jgi:hypothetical protein
MLPTLAFLLGSTSAFIDYGIDKCYYKDFTSLICDGNEWAAKACYMVKDNLGFASGLGCDETKHTPKYFPEYLFGGGNGNAVSQSSARLNELSLLESQIDLSKILSGDYPGSVWDGEFYIMTKMDGLNRVLTVEDNNVVIDQYYASNVKWQKFVYDRIT